MSGHNEKCDGLIEDWGNIDALSSCIILGKKSCET